MPKNTREFAAVALATSSNGNPRQSASTPTTAGSAEGTFGFCIMADEIEEGRGRRQDKSRRTTEKK